MELSMILIIVWLAIILVLFIIVAYLFNMVSLGKKSEDYSENLDQKSSAKEEVNERFYNIIKTRDKLKVTLNTGKVQTEEAKTIVRRLIDDHINKYGLYEVLGEEQIKRMGSKIHEANIIHLNSIQLFRKDRMFKSVEIYLKGHGIIGYIPEEHAQDIAELLNEYAGYNSKLHIVGGYLGGCYNYYDESLDKVISKNERADIILEIEFDKDVSRTSSKYIDKKPPGINIFPNLRWTDEYINFINKDEKLFAESKEKIPAFIKGHLDGYISEFRLSPYICPNCRSGDRFFYRLKYRNKIDRDIVNKYNCNALKRVVSCDIDRDTLLDVDRDINFEKLDSQDLFIDEVYTCNNCSRIYLSFYTSADKGEETSYPISRYALASGSISNVREYREILSYLSDRMDDPKHISS